LQREDDAPDGECIPGWSDQTGDGPRQKFDQKLRLVLASEMTTSAMMREDIDEGLKQD